MGREVKKAWRIVEICHIMSASTKSPRNNILLVLVIVYQGIQPDKTWGLGNWVSHLLPDMIDKSPPSVISAKLLFRRAAAHVLHPPPLVPFLSLVILFSFGFAQLLLLFLPPSKPSILPILTVYRYDLRGYTINWIYQPDSSSKRNSCPAVVMSSVEILVWFSSKRRACGKKWDYPVVRVTIEYPLKQRCSFVN